MNDNTSVISITRDEFSEGGSGGATAKPPQQRAGGGGCWVGVSGAWLKKKETRNNFLISVSLAIYSSTLTGTALPSPKPVNVNVAVDSL